MALQQLSDDLIEDNLILEQLSLDEIFNLCQAQRNTRYWVDRCNNQSFWQRIGQYKYPRLSKVLPIIITSSLGKFYRDLAEFLVMLNDYLDDEDYFGVTFEDVNSNDPRFYLNDDIGIFISENTLGLDAVQASFEISLLKNGRYHVVATTFDQSSYTENHSIYLSPDSFVEFFTTYLLISPSPGMHFKQEPRSNVDLEASFYRLIKNFI